MSRFITRVSISQSWFSSQVSRCENSFEIEQHINGQIAGIRLQPMANVVVVYGQFAEDLFLMGLQLDQELFELCLIKYRAGREGPGGMKLAFTGGRKPGKNHFAEVILRPFMDG